MERDQTRGVPITYPPQPDTKSYKRYGLGEWRDLVDDRGNAIQLSSQGAFGFSPWIDRQRHLIGVFLVNDRLPNIYQLVENIQKILRDAVDAKLATSNS